MNNKILGRYGEDIAVEFLTKKGYIILEKNFKNRCGEIDLVVRDGATIVFTEVKARRSLARGMPYESVHARKQRKLLQVALSYLKYHFGIIEVPARFDVVSIYQDPAGFNHIEHIPNAFDVAY